MAKYNLLQMCFNVLFDLFQNNNVKVTYCANIVLARFLMNMHFVYHLRFTTTMRLYAHHVALVFVFAYYYIYISRDM